MNKVVKIAIASIIGIGAAAGAAYGVVKIAGKKNVKNKIKTKINEIRESLDNISEMLNEDENEPVDFECGM